MVNIFSPLWHNVHLAVAQVPLIPRPPLHQADSIKHSHTIWIWQRLGKKLIWWGVLSAKIILNWVQHAELKLQATSFIHSKLCKIAKCVKLIRPIDFFSCLSACVCPPFGHDIDLCRIITFPGTVGILKTWMKRNLIRVNRSTNTSTQLNDCLTQR